jgi:hypothetical protein
MKLGPTPMEIAQSAWDGAAPDWVEALARACAASSQNAVAARLNRSAALVSQVLRRKYPGDLSAVEERVRGVLMAKAVACPALGTLPVHECQDWRVKARTFSNHNGVRVRMFRACNRCPLNRKDKT